MHLAHIDDVRRLDSPGQFIDSPPAILQGRRIQVASVFRHAENEYLDPVPGTGLAVGTTPAGLSQEEESANLRQPVVPIRRRRSGSVHTAEDEASYVRAMAGLPWLVARLAARCQDVGGKVLAA